MAKVFKKLTQTHVRIECGDGTAFNCPMLPISRLPEVHELSNKLTGAGSLAEFEAVRKEMLGLIGTVFPAEHSANLERLPVDKLSELVAYLMYGDDDDDPIPDGAGADCKKK